MDPATCPKCGGLRTQRYRPNGQKRGWQCKQCDYAQTNAWREANPEKAKASSKNWANNNKDRIAETGAIRYREKGDEKRAYQRAYRADNLAEDKARKRREYASNPLATVKNNRKRAGWAPGEHALAELLRPFAAECECCGSLDPRIDRGWFADHDHDTGLFRGFLCHPCNSRLGWAEKYNLQFSDIEVVYVQAHKTERAADIAARLASLS